MLHRTGPGSMSWMRCLACVLVLLVSSGAAEARRARAKTRPKAAPSSMSTSDAVAPTEASAPPLCPEPAAPPVAPTQVRVMLLDLESSPELASTARALGQVIAEEAARVDGFELLSSEEVRAVLEQEATKALMGCDDAGCLAELAGALDATLLISGQLQRTSESSKMVTLSLLNTRALVTVNRVSLAWPGADGRLSDVARAAAQLLVVDKARRPPGTLVLEGVPAGARVLVDGTDQSQQAASGSLRDLEVGIHEVFVSAPGFEPRTEHVLLLSGETAQVDASLVEVPLTSTWWFWTGTGAAVLAGMGITAALFAFTGPGDVTTYSEIPVAGIADVERVKGARP